MSDTVLRPSVSDRTVLAGREVLSGHRRGWRAVLPFAGPAVIASVAYTDPGNFATNIQAGSQYGYTLLWVVVVANAIAMLFQGMSAKLGIVTGKSLASLCRDRFPLPLVLGMWAISEIAAMATDLAEFLGAALGLSLLTGMPLMGGLALTGIITYALLLLSGRGFRPIELVIAGFVALIGASYLIELFIAPPAWGELLRGTVVPHLSGAGGLTLAVGIIGATVMPHAIYLHSSLTQNRVPARNDGERRRIIRFSNREVLLALGFAGLVNMAMIAMAAAAFHAGHPEVAEIESAYHTLAPLLGAGAAAVFLLSLLASGLSSSVVGTMAGQGIMQDFLHVRSPLWFRRLLTMGPAFVVVALGMDTTRALVLSQVVLSLALPVPMLALVWLTGRREVMGDFVSARHVHIGAMAAAGVVLALNAVLVAQTFGVEIPGLG